MNIFRTLDEQLAEISQKRKRQNLQRVRLQEEGFVDIDMTHDHWWQGSVDDEKRLFRFNFPRNVSLLDIFLKFVPPATIEMIISNITPGYEIMGQ